MDREDPTSGQASGQPLGEVHRFEWSSEQIASVSPFKLFIARALGIAVLLAAVAAIVFIALPVAIVFIVLALLAGLVFIARAWFTAKLRQWQDPAGKRRNVRIREPVPGEAPPTN